MLDAITFSFQILAFITCRHTTRTGRILRDVCKVALLGGKYRFQLCVFYIFFVQHYNQQIQIQTSLDMLSNASASIPGAVYISEGTFGQIYHREGRPLVYKVVAIIDHGDALAREFEVYVYGMAQLRGLGMIEHITQLVEKGVRALSIVRDHTSCTDQPRPTVRERPAFPP